MHVMQVRPPEAEVATGLASLVTTLKRDSMVSLKSTRAKIMDKQRATFLGTQQPHFCWESRRCSLCRWDAKSAPWTCVPGKRHNETDLKKKKNTQQYFFPMTEKCLSILVFLLVYLPSFSSFACGFALDLVAYWSPCWDPCPGCLGLASLSDSVH